MSYLMDLQFLPYRAGQLSFGSLVTTGTVVFSSPFPDSNYSTSLTVSGASNTTCILSANNQTPSGFTLNLAAGIVAGTTVAWTAWRYN